VARLGGVCAVAGGVRVAPPGGGGGGEKVEGERGSGDRGRLRAKGRGWCRWRLKRVAWAVKGGRGRGGGEGKKERDSMDRAWIAESATKGEKGE